MTLNTAGESVSRASVRGRRAQDEQEPAHPVPQLRAGGAQTGGGQEEERSDQIFLNIEIFFLTFYL